MTDCQVTDDRYEGDGVRFGYLIHNNNHGDWERHQTTDRSAPPETRDADQLINDLRLMETAVGYGFDTVWTSEHHFSPYLMVPNTIQLLSYVAGRCPTVDVGTAVVVLPWHEPIRVAEELIMLDTVLGGRKVFIGLGRGAGVAEFDGMRVPMGESRERFDEAVQIMLQVHRHGVGICGIFTYEVAETKVAQVIEFARRHQHPLQCTMEKE